MAGFSEKLVDKPKLNVIEGDILDIPFEDNSFDYAMYAVIHHLSNWKEKEQFQNYRVKK